jgi:acetyl esterase
MSLNSNITLALQAAVGATPYHVLPIEEARATARKGYMRSSPKVAVGQVQDLKWPGPQGPTSVRIYTPPSQGTHPAVVFFHGSGFVMLDLDTHDDICRRLCVGSNRVVVSVDYRLAPEYPFPAAPEDCLSAVLQVIEQATKLNIDKSRIALAGDSAGACLAAVTAWRLSQSHPQLVQALLLFYPVTDAPDPYRESYQKFGQGFGLSVDGMQWFWNQYMCNYNDHQHPHAAPLRAPNLQDMPRTYIVTAGYDVLRDEGKAYAERLKEAGAEVSYVCCETLNHGFLKYAGQLKEVDETLNLATRWLGHD